MLSSSRFEDVVQGAKAFEIWTGQPAPLRAMREALRAAVKEPAP